MRWSYRGWYSLEDLKDRLRGARYFYQAPRSDSSEYHFKKYNYHLIIKPKKGRINFSIHKDTTLYLRWHGRPLSSGPDIEAEKKKIVKVLEKRLT